MRKTRVIVAAALVATAVCADRVVAAAPVWRPEIAQTARQFAQRLGSSLRRVVATVRVAPQRQADWAVAAVEPRLALATPIIHATSLSPFQFRLPPPAV